MNAKFNAKAGRVHWGDWSAMPLTGCDARGGVVFGDTGQLHCTNQIASIQ